MRGNANITIYNKKTVGRQTYWKRTQIKEVNFFGSDEARLSGHHARHELLSADEYTIRIPDGAYAEGKSYADRYTFRALDLDEIDNYWSAAAGDLIVKKLIDDEISSPSELALKYDIMTVMSATENFRGMATRHLKLVCK